MTCRATCQELQLRESPCAVPERRVDRVRSRRDKSWVYRITNEGCLKGSPRTLL